MSSAPRPTSSARVSSETAKSMASPVSQIVPPEAADHLRQHRTPELYKSRELLQAALRSIAEAVIATDTLGNIYLLNRVAEELTGYEEVQAVGRNIQEIVQLVDEHGLPLKDPWWAVLNEGAIVQHRHGSIVRRSGGHGPIIESAAPIRDDDGNVAGAIIVLRDATRQSKAEEQLRQINHELYLFVRSISHDLREPLRMISLYSDMIRHELTNPTPDIQEYLRYVIGGAERMAALLTDLRAYAEITTPASQPAAWSDAELVLQMALANLDALTQENGAVVVHDPLPRVRVEQAHLLQLFQNLVSNAVKYRREEPPLIRIAASHRGELWEFSVSDNGIGIAPQYWDRVFDFFQRFHTTRVPGTGMGLAICQRIVQRYGGRIWLDSIPGNGSTFYFTLPGPQPHTESS